MNETQIEEKVSAEVKSSLTWIQKHERILIVALALGAGSWFGNHYLDNRATADKQTASIAAQQLDEQKAKDVQLAAQVTQLDSQYQAALSQLASQNAQLASAISNRTVVLQQQQVADHSMPLPDLGNRWAQLTGVQPSDITATPSTMTVTDSAARTTVDELEKVPVLTENLKDETTVADNRQTELDTANNLIIGFNTQVTNLNTTISDEDKACKTQVASVKAEAAKSKRNWLIRGLTIGASITAYLLR